MYPAVVYPARWLIHLAAWFLVDRSCKRGKQKGQLTERGEFCFSMLEDVRRTLGASDSDVPIWPSDIDNFFWGG